MFQRAAAAAGLDPKKIQAEMEERLAPLLEQLKKNESTTRENTDALRGLERELVKHREALAKPPP